MNERLYDIKIKILQLQDLKNERRARWEEKVVLNPVKQESELIQFEEENSINLPSEYRHFLLMIGNGGVILQPIENGRCQDLDYKEREPKIELNKTFEFKEKWNLNYEDYKDQNGTIQHHLYDKDYDNPKWTNGMLRIANEGCGRFVNLIVNGSEFGNIWIDDRCNDKGIYPYVMNAKKRVNFLDWYEKTLNASIKFNSK